MTTALFDGFLTTPQMAALFSEHAIAQNMFDFEAALARAQAAEGVIPVAAATAIASVCKAELHDVPAIIAAGSRAGSVAISLVAELTKTVALFSAEHAGWVHWGSTSQDVIDTAVAVATKRALALLDTELELLSAALLGLADSHAQTPVLARTLMQPAAVTSFGLKCVNWAAPLVRARARLRAAAARGLALQLGGAIGTLSVMGERGQAVARRVAAELGLRLPDAAWHAQRDEWVGLGLEVALVTGSLGKLATDIALMAQAEVAELAEPSGGGRGGSSAMPHKRNPVASMVALAAATRTPQRAAALLAAMCQQHERGLGNWQAELAEWPGLFLSAHGAAHALAQAVAGLSIDAERMQRNIDALQGLIFAEAATAVLAGAIGRDRAKPMLEDLCRRVVAERRPLHALVREAVEGDPALHDAVAIARLDEAFDPLVAVAPAARQARERLAGLRAQTQALSAAPWG